MVNRDIIDREF